ncbi:MAG: type II toxin-antitoxin system RelE/ParE family toxin, partial [Acidobacteriaceae bacterium]
LKFVALRTIFLSSLADCVGDDRLCDQGVRCFARKAGLDDAKLLQAARNVAASRYDADLGGGIFKQRVAREGGGKSGGFRTIILFRIGGHSFFAHGFAKNDRANVSAQELKALKQLADVLLGFSDEQIETAKVAGQLIEVVSDGDDKQKD